MRAGQAGRARWRRDDVAVLQRARDAGVAQSDAVAAAYYPDDTARQAVARHYLRDNIRYFLGDDELEGLRTFYRYAAELGLVSFDGTLRFYDADDSVSSLTASAPAAVSRARRRARALYHHAPLPLLGALADEVRARKHPDGVVTYIIDRNVNYTNVCVARCNFCAFYRAGRLERGLRARLRGDLPEDRRDDRARRRAAAAAGRPQSRSADRVVRGPVPRGEAALPVVQAARAVAARGDPPHAHVEADGAGGHRSPDRRRPRQHSRAAAPRSSSIACASCSTATARRPPTNGST